MPSGPETSQALLRDVVELRHQVSELRRQGAILAAVNRVLEATLTLRGEAEVATVCLRAAEKLTGSKFGFIGEVNESGRFDTIAITDPGWEACRMPQSDATRLIRNMEIRGVALSAVREGRSRIVNDPASHGDSVGVPRGHPRITSFLGVPLKRGGRTVGMFGLGNKDGGYDLADQEAVEALSASFSLALAHKRAERELRESRERLRRMLADATARPAPGNAP